MEGLHHRHENANTNKTTPSASNTIETFSSNEKYNKNHTHPSSNNKSSSLLYLLLPFLPFLLLYLLPTSLLTSTLKVRYTIYYTLALPLLSMLSITISSSQTTTPIQQRLIAASFVASTVLNQIPYKVSVCGFVAATVLLWFGLSSRPLSTTNTDNTIQHTKKNDDNDDDDSKQQRTKPKILNLQNLLSDGKVRATLAAFFVVIALLFENFLIWVVAASYKIAHNSTPTPLQDNGRIVLQKLASLASLSKHDLQLIRDVLNVPWSLVSSLATSFICVELHLGNHHAQKRSLWGVALRGLTALGLARTVRAISLTLTVLPSQIPNCYSKKFPNPPPEDWYAWIMVGLRPLTRGGCNDLIVSGHATITSLFACISASVCGSGWYSASVWFLLSVDFLVEMYQGLHYSVDMFLGGVIMSLCWKCAAPLEIDSYQGKNTEFVSLERTTVVEGIWYAVPIYAAWLVLTFGSSFVANGSIYVYLVVSVGVAVKSGGYTHYVQHLLLCILYVALAVYL